MEDEKEATRVCGRCHKEVAEVNFALHETHCSRFLCLCPDCDENVPRSELKKHREEQHGEVRCSKCHKKMERRHLPEHEEEDCPERPGCCEFCELELPVKELEEHTVACGSRTELCPDCGRYVKLSDQKDHEKTCSGQDQDPAPEQAAHGPLPKGKVVCKFCNVKFPTEEIKKHETTCAAASKWNEEESDSDDDERVDDYDYLNPQFTNMFNSSPVVPRADSGPNLPGPDGPVLGAPSRDPYELNTCPHCRLVLPRTTLRWHEGKCRVHTGLKRRQSHMSYFV